MEVEPLIKLGYDTWGSYGQYCKDIAVLRNGRLLDPERFARYVRGKRVVDFEGLKIEVDESSSRKNIHVTIKVPKEAVAAVIKEKRTTGRFVRDVEGEGEIRVEEETREFINDNKKYIVTYEVHYYVNGPIKIELEREKKDVKSELVSKPKVTVVNYKLIKTIEVKGDTYHIREQLKQLRLRWTGMVWRREYADENEANQIIEEIKKIAEVKVIE